MRCDNECSLSQNQNEQGKFKSKQTADPSDHQNNTRYGLGSAIFTENLARAHNVARKIEAGMVWINSSNDSDWRVPFGGVKESGIGRELGQAGMEAYSSIKAIHVNLKSKL